MAKSSIYFLSFSLLLLGACTEREWYKKTFSEETQKQYSTQLRAGGGYYYQGSVPEQFQLKEAMKMDSTDADLWREFGTARVKRGILEEMDYYYAEAVDRKPEKWAGFRGYLYLYFYRDYQRAIDDFYLGDEAIGEVGFSQGQNHAYMRGISYYGLEDYEEALQQLDVYIDEVVEKEGEEWVDVYAYLYRGLTLMELDRLDEALVTFSTAERIYPKLADLYFHRARIARSKGEYQLALDLLSTTEDYFNEGYFHQRPYVDVLEQVFVQDIEELNQDIRSALLVTSTE